MHIQNIFCVSRNYKEHALELQNNYPKELIVFLKSTHALTRINENTLFLSLS